MNHLAEYWLPYLISNSIALIALGLAWRKPAAARIALGSIFLLASLLNAYTAASTQMFFESVQQWTLFWTGRPLRSLGSGTFVDVQNSTHMGADRSLSHCGPGCPIDCCAAVARG